MVTKQKLKSNPLIFSFVLAKKLMVTKLIINHEITGNGFVLAKKLMVTKPG